MTLEHDMQSWLRANGPDVSSAPELGERMQSLWSGYGELRRVTLPGATTPRAVLKWVDPQASASHPRGWQSDLGHARKLQSYAVEAAFYRDWSPGLNADCRVAQLLAATLDPETGALRLLLEDLDAAGFAARPQPSDGAALTDCVDWLAAFHAHHLGAEPAGLWPVGCYWHFGTRAAEWRAMADGPLKVLAPELDAALNQARFQTVVHGDAKLANFCLDPVNRCGAAVDFQYVGGGVGVRDLVTLFASSLDDKGLEAHANSLLDHYFTQLRTALVDRVDTDALEREWRALWPLVWADYLRFLDGWQPGHTRRTHWAQARVAEALRAVG